MAQKKVVLLTAATREFGTTAAADTNDAQYVTVIPTMIEPATRTSPDVHAQGIKLWLQVTARTNGGDASAATLKTHIEEQDPFGNWIDVLDTTMTPLVTSSATLFTIWDPRLHTQTAAANVNAMIDKPIPAGLRVVVDVNGSSTVTPSFAFGVGVELYS